MILKLILLIGVVLGLLFGAHYLIYATIVRFLSLTSPAVRASLFGTMFLLALSLPAAAILVNLWENSVTRWTYALAATWMGLLVNLLLAALLSWLVLWISRATSWTPSPRWIVTVAAAAAVVYSGYGMYRAFFPRLHRIEVSIKDLPKRWRDKQIVQLSDLHLGCINRIGFLDRVVQQVNSVDAELVLITGDLFDGMGGDFPAFIGSINNLRARQGVFFVHGNHETYNEPSRIGRVLEQTHLRVLENEVVDVDGLQLVGINYPGLTGEEGRVSYERLRVDLSQAKPSILLFHTPTNFDQQENGRAEQHFTTYWVPDTSCAASKKLGVDLQLSGHTHAGQIFPFVLLSAMIYKGRDQGLHSDGTFHLYTSSGTGTWGPPMRTASRSEIVVIRLKSL